MPEPLRAVLFDLDGTLADTAPDLGHALNRLRAERGMPPVDYDEFRRHASSGARGMLRAGFGVTPDDADYEPLRVAFLDYYAARVCVDSRLFPGTRELLAALDARGLPWGVVTNKSERFTGPVLEALGLVPACVVSGDTTPHSKPHPAPMLLAAERLAVPPQACCYLGDDLRDIQAGRAAGMRCIAVAYGYHGVDTDGPRSWAADAVIERPEELLEHL